MFKVQCVKPTSSKANLTLFMIKTEIGKCRIPTHILQILIPKIPSPQKNFYRLLKDPERIA